MEPQVAPDKLEPPTSKTEAVEDSLKGKTFTKLSPSRAALEAYAANYGSTRVVAYEEMSGNTEVGTVELLKQVHWVENMPVGSLHTTGEYQAELLKILLKDRPKHVFNEGAFEGSETEEPEILEGSPVGDVTQEIIRDGKLPERLDDTVLRALAQRGAAWFYNQIEDSAVIHPTRSTAEYVEYEARLARIPDVNTPEGRADRDAIVMDHREQLAMAHVMKFLEEHPGETVYMIYGAAHQWSPEDLAEKCRAEDKRPQLNARVLPGLVAKDSLTRRIIKDLAKFPELERKVLSASRHVNPYVLPAVGDIENFKLALSRSGLDTNTSFLGGSLMAELGEQPERQALLLDKMLKVSPYVLTKITSAELLEYAVETANIRGDAGEYLVAADHIVEPNIELQLLGSAERLDLGIAGVVDSDEARQVVQIKSSSLADTRNVSSSVVDVEWASGAIERASALSPAVLRALPTAELQEQALPKIKYERANEAQLYDEEFIKKHAKSDKIAQSVIGKLIERRTPAGPVPLVPIRTFQGKVIETLLGLAHEPEAQLDYVKGLKEVPVMSLLALTTPEAKLAALEKLAPMSKGAQEALGVTFFQRNNVAAAEVIVEVAKRFSTSLMETESVLSTCFEHPEFQREIIGRSSELTFESLGYLSNEELQRSALAKLLPPPNSWVYDYIVENLPAGVRAEVEAKFSRPSADLP